MPFTYGFSPIIVSLGPFALRWYSLVYVVGFLLTYWLLHRFAKRGRIQNLDGEGAEEYIIWLIIGSIAVARLFYVVIYNPVYYWATPWKVVALWEGGMSFHGGLLGAVLATWWFCRRKKVSFYALADLLVVPLSLMLVFGRIANFVNGELVGRVTDVPWCVNYPWLAGCRHPSQFYEAAQNLVTFIILLPLYAEESIRKRLRPGTIFWLFVLLYGVGRFITNFWRAPDPTDPVLGGLLIGQWLSVIMALLAAGVLASRKFKITTNK
jgi:phosphatidylglycerol:prolipoprotein diacylglycerol transferase